MSDSSGKREFYKQLSIFLKALSHKVRTPLSIVVNDLSYFKVLLPEGETTRSLDKCKAISKLLSDMHLMIDGEFKIVPTSLDELTLEIEKQTKCNLMLKIDSNELSVIVDVQKFVLALKATLTTFTSLFLAKNSDLNEADLQPSITISTNDGEIVVVLSYNKILTGLDRERSFTACSEVVFNELKSDNPFPVLIDIVLSSLEIVQSISNQDEFVIKYTLPHGH